MGNSVSSAMARVRSMPESCLRRSPVKPARTRRQPHPRDGVDAAKEQLYVSAAPPATPTIIKSIIQDVSLPNAALQSSENVFERVLATLRPTNEYV